MPTVLYSAGLRFPVLQSYSTNFPATENPLSQGGIWLNGGTNGIDATDVRTTPGLAFATQVPHAAPPFDDSAACLSGYHPNQSAQATIKNPGNAANFREVELLLRKSITAHSLPGYEIDITTNFGLSVVVANAVGGFTVLASGITGPNYSTADGAVWFSSIVGTLITVICNGGTVTTYDTSGDTIKIAQGSPGIGFYADTNSGTPTADNSIGFSNFSCTEV